MPWSAKRKREERAKKRAIANVKKKREGSKLVSHTPPLKALRTYQKKDLGGKMDYGGHHKALNFPLDNQYTEVRLSFMETEEMSPTQSKKDHLMLRVGDLALGLAYDGDWKAKSTIAGNGERTLCKKSEKYLPFLLQVKKMVSPLVDSQQVELIDDTLRCNVLCGARTKGHTDSYRGNTPNLLFIVDNPGAAPGWLCYDTFPVFKASIVKIDGGFYIPHSYSEASQECRCIGEDPKRPGFPFFLFSHMILLMQWNHMAFSLGEL